MQVTRQRILEILKERGEATIEELGEALDLTSVTIRHHLDILRGEGLVEVPQVRRRTTPGRPQYVYTLTEAAAEYFPKNYSGFANLMISEVQQRLQPAEFDQVLQGMAGRMVAQVPPASENEGFEQRLDETIKVMNEKGYVTRWEKGDGAYFIHINNCPYRDISRSHNQVCLMDQTFIRTILGVSPERVSSMAAGNDHCTYRLSPAA